MSGALRAAIDVGSNSLLLTVVDERGAVVHDECRVVGLGRGLGERGVLAPDRMAAAREVLAGFVATARSFGIEPHAVRAVATSAARRALNAETFLEHVRSELGLRIRIVSGEEEALLTWTGALRDLPAPEGRTVDAPLLVVDVGGGSTELVQGAADRIRDRVSLEIGSVRLTERFLCVRGAVPDRFDADGVRALRDHVAYEVGRVTLEPRPSLVVGVAGTATTLAAMELRLTAWDAERVHGSALSRGALQRRVASLAAADRAQRLAAAAVSPERAEWLLAGAVILEAALAAAGSERMVVSDRGLRFGLLPDRS